MESSGNSFEDSLPPGFRFHPTDEELVVHYLKNQLSSSPLPVQIIAEIDLYKFDPWDLPGQQNSLPFFQAVNTAYALRAAWRRAERVRLRGFDPLTGVIRVLLGPAPPFSCINYFQEKAMFGEQEWYFFSPRDRKYPNGARPNRAAGSGYWKATGTDKPILTSETMQKVGVKKALVFYKGRPPKGTKTNWIMHEYRLIDAPSRIKGSLRLDDWVLCRIYRKTGHSPRAECVEEVLASLPDIDTNQHGDLHKGGLPKCLLEAEDPNLLEALLIDQDATSLDPQYGLKRNTDTMLDVQYPPAKRNIQSPFHHQQKLISDLQQMYRFPFAENRLWG